LRPARPENRHALAGRQPQASPASARSRSKWDVVCSTSRLRHPPRGGFDPQYINQADRLDGWRVSPIASGRQSRQPSDKCPPAIRRFGSCRPILNKPRRVRVAQPTLDLGMSAGLLPGRSHRFVRQVRLLANARQSASHSASAASPAERPVPMSKSALRPAPKSLDKQVPIFLIATPKCPTQCAEYSSAPELHLRTAKARLITLRSPVLMAAPNRVRNRGGWPRGTLESLRVEELNRADHWHCSKQV